VLVLAPAAAAQAKPDDGWILLFNGKNFDGWYSYLDSGGKNQDPKGVFKIENGMIRILDLSHVRGKVRQQVPLNHTGLL
jgi:hypothetical protein